jgi:phosphatidylglycerol:prolipoprotein diacylglycerol transferase
MISLAISYPQFDPVAISIGPVFGYGPLDIKWYGLAYVAGLILGWLYIRRLLATPRLWRNETPPFAVAKVDDLLLYMTGGVILGGRLGYVLLYEPATYFADPISILMINKGGMAFHGALVGTIIAIWLFAYNHKVNLWSTGDVCAAAVPIGLFFGRVANFINGELFGRVSDVPWAMVFPDAWRLHAAIEPATRHPSQLYEAAMEGLILFLVLRVLSHHRDALKTPGVIGGVFLAGYGTARIIAEFFREPHAGHALNIGPLTAGQMYSVPMVIAGVLLVLRAVRSKPALA